MFPQRTNQRTHDFGPLALKAVRRDFLDRGSSRTYVNDQIARIKRMLKWGGENELVPPSVYRGLQAVAGLKRGRCEARETEPVRSVPDQYVGATRPFVSRQVWAMIELQRLRVERVMPTAAVFAWLGFSDD